MKEAARKISHLKSQAGYILLSLMALTALIPGLVLIGLNYTDIIDQGSRISKTTITKTQMHTIRNIVANAARDVDADGAFDVWREGAGNTVPATVTVNSRDQWGTDFRYCAYDLLACNQVNATFSQNNPNAPCAGFSPPTTNLVLRIISAGRDRVFQTDCRSTSALGDDIVMNETEAGIRIGGGGALPAGTAGQTLRHDGTNWVANSVLVNDGTNINIGTPTVAGSVFINYSFPNVFLRGNTVINQDGLRVHYNETIRAGTIDVKGASLRLRGESGTTGEGGTERVFIDLNSGNVGIGTGTPQQRLDVAGYIRSSFASNEGPGLMLTNPLKTGAGTARDWIIFNMTGGYGNSLQFWAYDTLGCIPGGLCAPRFTITDAGNVGIGTTTPIARLHVAGNSHTAAIITAHDGHHFHSDWPAGWGGGLATWDIVGAGALFSVYLTRSDINRKTDIEEIKYGLPAVMNLRPVMFRWKDDKLNRPLKDIGFISQEVEKIIPELVIGEDGNKGLSYDRITAVLVKAIQEQQREIEELKSNIEQLGSNNATASQNSNKIDIDTAFKIIAMSLIIALSIKISRVR